MGNCPKCNRFEWIKTVYDGVHKRHIVHCKCGYKMYGPSQKEPWEDDDSKPSNWSMSGGVGKRAKPPQSVDAINSVGCMDSGTIAQYEAMWKGYGDAIGRMALADGTGVQQIKWIDNNTVTVSSISGDKIYIESGQKFRDWQRKHKGDGLDEIRSRVENFKLK